MPIVLMLCVAIASMTTLFAVTLAPREHLVKEVLFNASIVMLYSFVALVSYSRGKQQGELDAHIAAAQEQPEKTNVSNP